MAAEYVRRAIAAYQEMKDDREVAACLLNYSRILYALGDFAAVRPTLDRGLTLGRRYGLRFFVANVLQETAMHQVRAGEYAEATENLEEALRTNREVGFPLGEGYDYLLFGRISFAVGDLNRASEYLNRALTLFRKIECQYEASALETLARIHHARGELDQAAELIDTALRLFETDRRPPVEIMGEVRITAAALKFDMEGPGSALAEYEAVTDLAIKGGARYEHARALEGVARCELRLGRVQPGIEHLREAVDAYKRIGAVEYGPAASRLASLADSKAS